jgi:hypothetical protein
MRLIFPLLALLLAPPAAAADAYKWVDASGVVTYGDVPPPGVGAQPLTLEPHGFLPAPRTVAPAAAGVRRTYLQPPALAPQPVGVHARDVRGMAFDTFIRLQRGMSEGELVRRAGLPDHVTLEDFGWQAYHYFPTASDPFHTIVTLRGGRIHNLERTRQF